MPSPEQEARLAEMSRAFRMMRADVGDLTADDIRRMSHAEFARLRASVLGDEATAPTRPTVAPVADEPHGSYAEDMPEHMGVPDFRNMGMSDYGTVRSQFIRPGNSRGIFDQ